MSEKEKILAVVSDEIDTYEHMVATEMRRIKEQSDPALVAIEAEAMSKYNHALKVLKELKKKMEEAQ